MTEISLVKLIKQLRALMATFQPTTYSTILQTLTQVNKEVICINNHSPSITNAI